jgi:RNA polymerase sigma factor (sigma-70 family)
MALGQISDFIQHLRRTALLRDGEGLTDGKLLGRFIDHRDNTAFARLVQQHGPMVWAVCRRTLSNLHDAEDAFQATFLVLVRKATSVSPREMVANWLYGVAHQTALKAKALTAKRRTREKQVAQMPEPQIAEPDCWNDLQPFLDLALSRLPDSHRVVIVLCDLEGKTRKEAARQLGCSEGTVAGRLTRGRRLLAQRLARHGLIVSSAMLATVLSQKAASAGVPSFLVNSTIKAASLLAAGQAAATGVISTNVSALTNGVVKAMLIKKLMAIISVFFVVAMIGISGTAGVTLLAPKAAATEQAETKTDELEKPASSLPSLDGQHPSSLEPRLRATLKGHTGSVLSVAFSPDGKILASGSGARNPRSPKLGCEVKLWDVQAGKEKQTLKGHTGTVMCVVFSPDGKTLASGGLEDKAIKLWDVATGKEQATLNSSDQVVSVAFSPNGKTLASGTWDNTVRLWDVATGKEQAVLKGHAGIVWSVAYSPDGKTLASGSLDQTIKLWDVQTGKEQATLKGHTKEVRSVAFSPDGKSLASASDDKMVIVWDVTLGKMKRTLKGHTHWVWSVAYSPDNDTLASGSWDKTTRLWDVAKGKERAILNGHKLRVLCVAYSPDGKTLASGSSDGTINLWDLSGHVSPAQGIPQATPASRQTGKEVIRTAKRSEYMTLSADGIDYKKHTISGDECLTNDERTFWSFRSRWTKLPIGPAAKITIDGKEAKLADLHNVTDEQGRANGSKVVFVEWTFEIGDLQRDNDTYVTSDGSKHPYRNGNVIRIDAKGRQVNGLGVTRQALRRPFPI